MEVEPVVVQETVEEHENASRRKRVRTAPQKIGGLIMGVLCLSMSCQWFNIDNGDDYYNKYAE